MTSAPKPLTLLAAGFLQRAIDHVRLEIESNHGNSEVSACFSTWARPAPPLPPTQIHPTPRCAPTAAPCLVRCLI